MSEQETAVTVVEGQNFDVQNVINRAIVVEMADTLMGIHPGAQDVGVIGMRST